MNYIGSKVKLIDFISKTIKSFTGIQSGTGKVFADLFSGTGIVAKTFKEQGYQVLANDIQYYSYVRIKHLIANNLSLPTHHFSTLNNLEGIEGFIYDNYCQGSGSGRLYFSDENGMRCDHIRSELEVLKQEKIISQAEYYFILASLIESVDKCANTASIYGSFLKKLKPSAQKSLVLEPLPIVTGNKGIAYNYKASNLITQIRGDVLYLDPPYNHRQYCSNYHLLETIARNDNPSLHGITGLRDCSNEKSEFCSKKNVGEALEYLVSCADFPFIVLSYSADGLLSPEMIQDIMKQYGEYSYVSKEYQKYGNSQTTKGVTTEYLHCLRKK